ncbi:MAG: hypothetical protein D6692_06940 [Planctomycetota bacterium]|nr:MAG: hypothetical protein D6692_06940 [Planctomycetota bacterium]
MPRLRLVTDDIEQDPPAPLPIANWRRTVGDTGDATDSIAEVEKAFARVERAVQNLSDMIEEMDPIPFPRRGDDDDDGPWAA